MDKFNHLVGKKLVNASEVVSLEGSHIAQQTVEQLAIKNGLKSVRICVDNGFTDMEFREDRLKVTTDDRGIIKRVGVG